MSHKSYRMQTIEMQTRISFILCFTDCGLWPVAWLQRALCHSYRMKITW